MSDNPIDWFYQFENLKSVCQDVIWNIIDVLEEVEDSGRFVNFQCNSATEMTWWMNNEFITVMVEDHDPYEDWVNTETLTIPFDWLDMNDEQLREAIKEDTRLKLNLDLDKKSCENETSYRRPIAYSHSYRKLMKVCFGMHQWSTGTDDCTNSPEVIRYSNDGQYPKYWIREVPFII